MSTNNIIGYYLGWNLVNHLLRDTVYTPPASVYAALYSTAGPEISGNGYARVQCPSFTVTGNTAVPDSTIEFDYATANWGEIARIGITDAPSGGNILFLITLDEYIKAATGEALEFADLSITLKGDENGGWGADITTDILNFVLNNDSFSSPGLSVYIALGRTVIPDVNYNFSSWSEIGGAGYARMRVGGTSYWSAGGLDMETGYSPLYGGTYTENLGDIVFTENATGNWGTVANFAIFNSLSSGNVLFWGKLGSSKYVTQGDGIKFANRKVKISIL